MPVPLQMTKDQVYRSKIAIGPWPKGTLYRVVAAERMVHEDRYFFSAVPVHQVGRRIGYFFEDPDPEACNENFRTVFHSDPATE